MPLESLESLARRLRSQTSRNAVSALSKQPLTQIIVPFPPEGSDVVVVSTAEIRFILHKDD